jgi:hypothetical protein
LLGVQRFTVAFVGQQDFTGGEIRVELGQCKDDLVAVRSFHQQSLGHLRPTHLASLDTGEIENHRQRNSVELLAVTVMPGPQLTQAVVPYGLGYLDIPDPVNLFQNTRPKADGTIDYQPAAAQAGEYISLKALMDCLVAISACPFDQEIDGKRLNHPMCTPLRVEFVAE